jgi:cytochrome d ubiquinol oxidase subunit II
METLWFCLVAFMLAAYVVFDGFDLGAGIAHLFVARTSEERRAVLATIGPVWDGNEVWLLAAGGTLYFAFPALYAAGFSGFYLPLMMVLWLLILRGCAIEFRNKIESQAWKPLWDAVFWFSSSLLAIFLGAALGNVIRGVPFDDTGRFFEPLWTDFWPGPNAGILDSYTVLVGIASYAALAMHGALWVALKSHDPIRARARKLARTAWGGTMIATAAVTWSTLLIQPQVIGNLTRYPWGFVFPALALAGLGGVEWFTAKRQEARAFFASCGFLAGMLASAAFGIYPQVLPSITDPARALTIWNASAGSYGLKVGVVWWLIGMVLAAGYFVYVYRQFAGKVSADHEGGAY